MAGTILHIETATSICSVALSQNGEILSIRESSTKNAHSAVLTTFIEEVVDEVGIELSNIDAIAVSSGPGSYTGLRIGVAAAKGLCYSLDRPLIAVPTLQAMAFGMEHLAFSIEHLVNREPRTENREPRSEKREARSENPVLLLCPMLDARRMEVYCAIYDTNFNEVMETRAEIIDENSFSEILKDRIVVFAGDGAAKCKSLLVDKKNVLFIDSFETSARFMIAFAEEKLTRGKFEDIAYYEPFYLKDFVAGKPRVKGLH